MFTLKNYRHPLHVVNSYRAVIKKALREQSAPFSRWSSSCSVNHAQDFYFIIEYSPNNEKNELIYGITCFDSDGCIIFNVSSLYPVSLWRFRRQGAERSALIFRGIVMQAFQRCDIMLNRQIPFEEVGDNVYHCNISNWLN